MAPPVDKDPSSQTLLYVCDSHRNRKSLVASRPCGSVTPHHFDWGPLFETPWTDVWRLSGKDPKWSLTTVT